MGDSDGSRLKGLLTRDNNYFNNEYITGALSPEGIISGLTPRDLSCSIYEYHDRE